MTTELLEERLAAVDRAVAEIRRQLAGPPPATNGLARFDGAFADEPAFDDVIRYGREVREHGPCSWSKRR